MVSLIDNLQPEVWQEVEVSKKGEGFAEYHINRQKKFEDPNTLSMFLTNDSGDPTAVKLQGTRANNDPFKAVAVCEFKVQDGQVVGVDLNGDVVLKKT